MECLLLWKTEITNWTFWWEFGISEKEMPRYRNTAKLWDNYISDWELLNNDSNYSEDNDIFHWKTPCYLWFVFQ